MPISVIVGTKTDRALSAMPISIIAGTKVDGDSPAGFSNWYKVYLAGKYGVLKNRVKNMFF